MTLVQIALAAAVAVVLAGWCLRQALHIGPPSIAEVYRRLYGGPAEAASAPRTGARWERPIGTAGRLVAASTVGERFAESKVYELRVADATVAAIATRILTAALVGLFTSLIAAGVAVQAAAGLPWWLVAVGPLAVAAFAGWYQYTTIVATLARRYSEFRAGVAAYIALVSVCLTTRRSATEAVTYAADVGSGPAFTAIAASVHAAPQMGLQAWEALDAIGVEYGTRELDDLATSIANVASIGVGVETTVVAVASRMRQVGLDEMQRHADRQTATMFGPTMLFVVGTIAFLAYPLSQRVLDAFVNTT